ncbi:hypothetical protein HNV10_09460 [Winogradskyella litoriviva]|uniref:Uncharacterized protein n=1 Tax=Winogradskyella litoriviva TaxID=1220182 RepID=A0ABX2E4S5_9FLAO|nr:hypothetical protein [Winogradskyella litoriviva]NRD23465.1 hypothetical protein [Winogradskyella litoriviva]
MNYDTNNEIELDNSSNKTTNSWLQRLKDESWEAELLVSAIAIFGTFQLFEVIDWATNKLINTLDPSQYLVGYAIVFIGLFAISILASMFVIHFFLRAYWIGLVGLNSVFPDYSIEDSAYSKIYTEKILSILPKLEDSIKKVDELCSVIFSAAFTFLLMYSYMAILACVYLLVFNMLSSYVHTYILLIPLVLFIAAMLFQMVIGTIANLKKNKEKENLQILYFKAVKYGSLIMIGPLYKSILQVSMIFGSNFKKNKSLAYLMLSFLIVGMPLAVIQMNKTNIPYLIKNGLSIESDDLKINPSYYQSENTNSTFLLAPEIESDIIKSEVVRVFIPIFDNEKKMREGTCDAYVKDSNKSKVEQRKEERLNFLDCYRKYNTIYLNEEKKDIDFLKYTHPITKQFGIIGYVPLNNEKFGMQTITIKKEFNQENIRSWSIPFYYTQNN